MNGGTFGRRDEILCSKDTAAAQNRQILHVRISRNFSFFGSLREKRPFEGRRGNYKSKHPTSENSSYILLHVWSIFQAFLEHN
jgi:hypothetical protein